VREGWSSRYRGDSDVRVSRAIQYDGRTLMVQLWCIHSGEISLCEQMVTQLRMAVLSGELKPGERLPSGRGCAGAGVSAGCECVDCGAEGD
jgi:hypothetical protein